MLVRDLYAQLSKLLAEGQGDNEIRITEVRHGQYELEVIEKKVLVAIPLYDRY